MTRRAGFLGIAVGVLATAAYALAATRTTAKVSDIVLVAILPLAFLIAGGIAAVAQPENVAARRLLQVGGLHLVAFWLGAEASAAADRAGVSWSWNVAAGVAFLGGMASLVGVLAVFPDGRATSRGRLWLPRIVGASSIVLPSLNMVLGSEQPLVVDFAATADVTAPPFSLGATNVFGALAGLLLVSPAFGFAWVVASYRRARSPIDRLRMRWPLIGAGLLAAALVLTGPGGSLVGEAAWTVVFVSVALLLPASLLVAIVRYRLFDVQILVRRSVVCLALTAAVSAAYAAIAVGLGLTAGRLSVAAAVGATVAAALAFQPIRQRLERAVRQYVFGARDDPLTAVFQLTVALESTLDVRSVVPLVENAASRAVRAPSARVVFGGGEAAASGGGDLVLPLDHAGERLGALVLERRPEPYEPEEIALLGTLSRHASLALSNARLTADLDMRLRQLEGQTAELLASRRRILTAQESERRRIERNIHDGVQQQAVALLAGLETLRARLPLSADDTAEALRRLQTHTRAAIGDLRTLAAGIHPAVLTDEGLCAAVAALAGRLPTEVRLRTSPNPLPRLPSDIEAAAYFFVAEGITNAMKHAGVDFVHVGLVADRALRVEVTDLGSGFDSGTTVGEGLQGMRDRVEGLGGRLDIRSAPLEGTRLVATIPLPPQRR